MELYLIRHAHAGNPDRWSGPDALRPLSERGRRQAERLAALLRGLGFAPDALLTSPKARALQTADIVGLELGRKPTVVEVLAGPFDLSDLASITAGAGDPERPALVGHDPDLSQLASVLVGARIELRKGALARIDLPAGIVAGAGVLRWLVPPELLGS